MADLVSIGLSVIDYVFLCAQEEGSLRLVEDHVVQGGGMAATAAVTMARLGASVELWTRVGDGTPGRFIIEQLEAERVDTSQVRVCPGGRSPACAVLVDRRDGERRFIFFPGRGLDPSTDHLDHSRLDRAKAVLVDCTWPEAQILAARRARERGVPVCGDIERLPPEVLDLVPLIDYPIYSLECARAWGRTGSVEGDLRAVAELGGIVPMITLGDQGCIWLEEGKVRRLPAFEVEVVDTTGCGDVFHGAFAFGLAQGWDVETVARFASATAALKCRALGGRTGIPSYGEVVAFLDQHRGTESRPTRTDSQ